MTKPKKNKPLNICLCNSVTKEKIEQAIREGAKTLDEIYDLTTAGVGACGGTCRPDLKYMLDTYKDTGQFPENPRITKRKK